MKRVLIGGFLSIIGSIWTLAVSFGAWSNPAESWTTPPGRFLTSLLENDLLLIFAAAAFLIAAGLGIMFIELFRKDQ